MAKQLPPQVQSALLWAKSNTIVVVFCAIVLVVPAAAFVFAGKFADDVREDAQKKASVHSDLSSMAKKSVSLPIPGGEPFPLAGLPNEDIVREYEQILTKVGDDARAVYTAARDFNAGTGAELKHAPIVPSSVFPNYNRANRSDAESVRFRFGDALRASYERLLADCRTGVPLEPTSLKNAIEAAEKRFVQGELKQESRAKLDAAQTAALDKQLGKARIEQYFEIAKRISFYVDPAAFPIPTREVMNKILPTGSDPAKAYDAQDAALFDEQWKFWIISDVLHAFRDANAANPSVLQAPLKRVMQIRVLPVEGAASASAGSGEASAMGGEVAAAEGDAAAGDASAAGAATGTATAALGPPQVDPKVEAPRDFSRRFTGRVSNPVYDVRLVEVVFVAETARLPRIFDALASRNFMTVANVRLSPADPFEAARDGYLYGVEPVSEVRATIETIWLREWTAVSMPAVVRSQFGISTAAPAAEEASSAG
ncbi:MAG: hypothetical protein GC172_04370 [Phycisphaera sp.]|nr:hypothetical protein [Phycisphaera sp.]